MTRLLRVILFYKHKTAYELETSLEFRRVLFRSTAPVSFAVDPGHGGKETGAVSRSGLAEKDVNLRIGLKLAGLLRAGSYVPVLTRDCDRQVNTAGQDLNANGVVDVDDDLQARVDAANAAHADIVVSIHT